MSAYDNDPRVTSHPASMFIVVPESGPVNCVCPGQLGGFVTHDVETDVSHGHGFDTADEAIRSLIGDPQ